MLVSFFGLASNGHNMSAASPCITSSYDKLYNEVVLQHVQGWALTCPQKLGDGGTIFLDDYISKRWFSDPELREVSSLSSAIISCGSAVFTKELKL